jgi:hypothetical protein
MSRASYITLELSAKRQNICNDKQANLEITDDFFL